MQIEDATANSELYIQQLTTMSKKKLEKTLLVVRGQMQLALEQKFDEAYELLRIWEHQIITAIDLKSELPQGHKKADEMEEAIAHIETMQQKSEQRIQILEELNNTEDKSKADQKIQPEDQLNLF